jgi:hypothetical protein
LNEVVEYAQDQCAACTVQLKGDRNAFYLPTKLVSTIMAARSHRTVTSAQSRPDMNKQPIVSQMVCTDALMSTTHTPMQPISVPDAKPVKNRPTYSTNIVIRPNRMPVEQSFTQ